MRAFGVRHLGPGSDGAAIPLGDATVRVVATESEFLALRPAWETLARRERPPLARFLLFDAALAGWETVARPAGYRLHVLVASRGDAIVAILPLVSRRVGPLRLGRWLGSQNDESCTFLHAESLDEATLVKVWDAARSHFHLLHFSAVHPSSRLRPFFEAAHHARRTARHPFVMCRQWSGWEAYLAGLSASLRREYRRDTKRLRELGDVAFAVSTSDADIAAVLDWIIDKKVDWIVGSGAPADEFLGKRAYYHRFFAAMQRAGRLIVFELSVGGVPVAAQVALKWDDRLLLELSGWDYGWRAYSPGNVLAFEIIRWAFENDFGVVDLGMGGHAYKYHFTKSDEEVARHVLVASRPIGRLVVAAVNMRLRLRRKPAAKPLAGSRIREQALAWIAALCPVLQVVEPLLLV